MPTTSPLNQQDVARLVSEVISRIRAETGQPERPPAATPATPAPATDVAAAATVTLTNRVVSVDILERLPAATASVRLPARAVVTPSARDLARDRGIALLPAIPQAAAASGRPLVIARADCRADVSRLAAGISRAVPASQQLPAAGMASVVAALADHAGRDAAQGLLLTDSPAVACVAANRHASLRAVTGTDAASLEAAADACAANLLIVEPGRFSAHTLERLVSRFASQQPTSPPALLAVAAKPASCSCQHAH